ncbi:LysE family transporter [Saccharopolyspora mangrovi]|uniref:LysE family transporter n=1 Tax=Saccharopolyspora mangrovi TaxID=3082379 RepID=A0ABU6AEL3_9PSEU|nr:LysE family transporter [Saccharopolyspora sp. S2-29]MEB3369965.1 LysE family transporter [Saccharopolyspora sp. S2-29]
MSGAVLAGLLAGFGIAVPVGAVGIYLVSLSARSSFAVASAAGLGVAAVDGAYALVAVLGGSALLEGVRGWAEPLRWASVVVLVLVAGHIALSALRTRADQRVRSSLTPLRAFLTSIAMTSVNPTTVVYFAAVVVGGGADIGGGAGERAAFALSAWAASACWQLVLVAGGSLLGRGLSGRRGRVATAVVSSVLIVVLAVRAAVS